MNPATPAQLCCVLPAVLGPMKPESATSAISAMRTTAAVDGDPLESLLRHPLVTAFEVGRRKLAGPPALERSAIPLRRTEYVTFRDSPGVPLWMKQAAVLMWVRGARWADVGAMRQGSIWRLPGRLVGMEAGAEKTSRLGKARRIEVVIPPAEKALLAPLLTVGPSPVPQRRRLPLLPDMDRRTFQEHLRQVTGNPQLTTHSFRHGVVATTLAAGHTTGEVRLLTGHRTEEGFAPYQRRADEKTRRTLRSLAAALSPD